MDDAEVGAKEGRLEPGKVRRQGVAMRTAAAPAAAAVTNRGWDWTRGPGRLLCD